MDNERLQEIKEGDYLLHGTEEWMNQEDADTEAVILELIAAYEAAQADVTRERAYISLMYKFIELNHLTKLWIIYKAERGEL